MEMVKTNQEVKARETVIPLDKNLPWLEANAAAKEAGNRLPSNVLLDKILLDSDYKSVRDKLDRANYFGAWTNSFLVYPEKNSTFKSGKDVLDYRKDDSGRKWKFLESDVPKQAIGKKGVALYFECENVEISGKTVIVHPRNVTVLSNFLQESGWGKVDETTRIPLESANITEAQKRYLWRNDYESVRPLVRGFNGFYGRRYVFSYSWPDFAFGVGVVGRENAATAPRVSVADAALQLKPLIRNVNKALGKLSETVKQETLAPIYDLVRALDIKE